MCIFRQKVITQHTDYSVGSAEWASQVALVVKNPPASAAVVRDAGLIPGLGRSPGEVIGYPLQYSWAFLVAQTVKNPHAMREIGV